MSAESASIAALFLARAAAHAGRPLLLDADTGAARSYAEVAEAARRWAAWYRAEGLGVGDRAAVVLPNGPTFAALYLGAALAGVTLAPFHAGLTAPELADLARRHRARLLLATAPRAAELAAALEVPVHAVGPTGALPAGLPAPAADLPEVDGAVPLVLIMTSGTSGGAKACVLPQASLVATSAAAASAFGLGPGSRYLTPLPLHHINAQVVGLLAAVQAGGAVALGARLPPAKLWEAAARVGATGMSAVPAIVHDLLALPAGAVPPPSLRYVVCSSAALAPAARAAFEARFGIPLLFCYGLSEAGCFVAYSRVEPPSPAGSVGRPVGCEVAIAEGGEIRVRGPGLFAGYDGDPAATAHALRDGWLHTGDLGRLDAAGFLYVEGRLKDLINRGGEKIAPDAVEAVLARCPGVAAVAVYGVPDARLGEEVAAAVVPAPGADLDEEALFDYCAEHLAEFETPKTWRFVAELPRGRTGKVLRRALRELP